MDYVVVPPPAPSEYAPFYAGYVSLVPGSDVVRALTDQAISMTALLRRIPEDRGDYRYGRGKWSVKEVLGHVIDAERIFTYRALRFARGDSKPLHSFDQELYVGTGAFGHRQIADLAEEFSHVRAATVLLFGTLDEDAWRRSGIASENPVTVRALAYITAGHELHHRRILEERYLPGLI